MKKEQMSDIAKILSKNLSSTILLLNEIGYDFSRIIEEQTSEVDERLASLLMEHLTTNVPASTEAEESTEEIEVLEEPTEEQGQYNDLNILNRFRVYQEKIVYEIKGTKKEIGKEIEDLTNEFISEANILVAGNKLKTITAKERKELVNFLFLTRNTPSLENNTVKYGVAMKYLVAIYNKFK